MKTVKISLISIDFTLENLILNDDLVFSFNAGKLFQKVPPGIWRAGYIVVSSILIATVIVFAKSSTFGLADTELLHKKGFFENLISCFN